MNACEYKNRLMAYHDGELPAEERAAVEAHLPGCAACRHELERLGALSRVLGMASAPAMPQGLPERLREALRPARELEIIRICRVASAVAAALLAVCALSLWSSRPPQASVQAPRAWEVAAVTLDADLAQAEWDEAFAQWVVDDLSQENGL